MTEWQMVLTVPARMLVLTAFSTCYVIGGRSQKWIRRFVGGSIIGCSCVAISMWTGSYNPWIWLTVPAYVAALTMGYGGDDLQTKAYRRFLYGLAVGSVSLIIAAPTGLWVLSFFQIFIAVVSSVFLGLLNPAKDAVKEEGLIATLSVAIAIFMV